MSKSRLGQIIIKSIAGLLIVGIIISTIFAVVIFAKSAYHIGYEVFAPTAYEKNGKDIVIDIPKNAGTRKIVTILYENKLVRNKLVVYLQLKLSKYKKTIVPGKYVLNSSMLPDEMFSLMSKNKKGTS